MFFFDSTTTMAELAMSVMRMKNGAMVPSGKSQISLVLAKEAIEKLTIERNRKV